MASYRLIATNGFKKDYRRLTKRGWNLSEIDAVIETLLNGSPLASKHRSHALKGERKGQMDCHIRDDWVLIYEIVEENRVLILLRTGSHSDLNL
jgi:mRNA interferase YafQ